MSDRDVEVIRIIVCDGLPVEIARTMRHPPNRAKSFELIGRHLMIVGSHHFVDGRQSLLEPDEQETAPIFQRHRDQAQLLDLDPRIFVTVHDTDQPSVAGIAPGVIGAGQYLGAAAVTVDQPRAAMAADVGEGTDIAIIAANDDDALAKKVDRSPLTRVGDLAFVANHLRRGAKERPLLRLEELGVVIEPAGKAHIIQGVSSRVDALQVRRHVRPFATWQRPRQSGRHRSGLAALQTR